MFKSTKKLLSALLALVMVLSILPVAVFAEETHTHDEICDCVSVLATCSHSSYVVMSANYRWTYAQYTSSQHKRVYYSLCMCNSCGATFDTPASPVPEFHNANGGKTWTGDTETIEGELNYIYDTICECGYKYKTYSIYPPN